MEIAGKRCWGSPSIPCHCSFTQSCPTLCNPMNCSTPGSPVLHHLLEFTQTHVYWVSGAIQLSHPLSPPSPDLSPSQNQSLLQWVSFSHQESKVLELQLYYQSSPHIPQAFPNFTPASTYQGPAHLVIALATWWVKNGSLFLAISAIKQWSQFPTPLHLSYTSNLVWPVEYGESTTVKLPRLDLGMSTYLKMSAAFPSLLEWFSWPPAAVFWEPKHPSWQPSWAPSWQPAPSAAKWGSHVGCSPQPSSWMMQPQQMWLHHCPAEPNRSADSGKIINCCVNSLSLMDLNAVVGLPWWLSCKESICQWLPMQELWVWSLGWDDPLEKQMATHSNILALDIPWTEKPGGLQSMEVT